MRLQSGSELSNSNSYSLGGKTYSLKIISHKSWVSDADKYTACSSALLYSWSVGFGFNLQPIAVALPTLIIAWVIQKASVQRILFADVKATNLFASKYFGCAM